MLEILRAPVPLSLNVMVLTALGVFMAWFPNTSGVGESPTEGAVPVPVRGAVCGLPEALSVTVTEALLGPRALGVNVTLMTHRPPAATLVPHVFVSEKSPEFAPVMPTLAMLRVVLWLLTRLIPCALLAVFTSWLPNPRLPGERLTGGKVAVPERATPCGLPVAASTTVSAVYLTPARNPVIGANVTLIVQLPPTATLVPQLFV